MRKVYVVSGGVSKFAKARPDKTFQAVAKESFDYAIEDLGFDHEQAIKFLDGMVASYFSDHFNRQLMAGIMVQDYIGMSAKPGKRVEGGGATGGLCFQTAWTEVASGRMDTCLAIGWETMSRVNTWKGNEFIALASDVSFDYPVGGFYSGYYAMMVVRHMHEFGTTVEQLAKVSVKNHTNALPNKWAQKHIPNMTVKDVRNSPMVAYPLTRQDICVMSDGAASVIFASEEIVEKYNLWDRAVLVTGVGTGTDAMRMSDRPHKDVMLLPHEKEKDYVGKKFVGGKLNYPGVHSFRAGRSASAMAYKMAGITNPLKEIDFVELHDAYTSSEIQTYEDMGLCKYGEGGKFVDEGHPFIKGVNYGFKMKKQGIRLKLKYIFRP